MPIPQATSGPNPKLLCDDATTRLATGGCTHAKVATFMGHSLNDIARILDAHYLSRDPRLAESALKKREMHEAGTKATN